MTNTIDELILRKSTRSFSDQKISAEDKEAILLASINAPTAGNQQPYKIIDVTDRALMEKLSDLCDHQPFVAQGQMVLVYCADFRKWYDAFVYAGCDPRPIGVGDMMLSVEDTMIAAQNAVCAAESLGIGSCYIGDILENKEAICELLHLPEYVIPATLIVFGYPAEGVKNRKKPKRESLKTIVCENEYHLFTQEETEAMFMEKQNLATREDYLAWMKAFCNRKYNSDFSREMKRSVAEYIKEFE